MKSLNKNKIRKSLRKRRGVRREEILDIAIDVIFEHGYHKTSIRDISDKLGLTKAAIYYHFSNKEEILFNIIDQVQKELSYIFKSSISQDKDPIENLRNLIANHILYMKSHRKAVKVLLEDKKFLSGEQYKLTRDKETAIFYLFRSYIEEMQRQGKLSDFDATAATFGIFGMINSLYHWYSPDKKLTIEQIADQFINILFHGLLSEATTDVKD